MWGTWHSVQIVCRDYPRPPLETSPTFLQAAALSAQLREFPRPERPLKVIIAGAGTPPCALTPRLSVPQLYCTSLYKTRGGRTLLSPLDSNGAVPVVALYTHALLYGPVAAPSIVLQCSVP